MSNVTIQYFLYVFTGEVKINSSSYSAYRLEYAFLRQVLLNTVCKFDTLVTFLRQFLKVRKQTKKDHLRFSLKLVFMRVIRTIFAVTTYCGNHR